MRLNFLIFAVAVLAVFALTSLYDSVRFPARTASGFSFQTLDGKTHHLNNFQGKTVIINFWASWCPPCVKEFPLLIDTAQKHPEVILIALSSDVNDQAIADFVAQQKISPEAPNIYIARDQTDIAGNLFGTFKLPETFIIDHNRKIRAKFIGADWQPADLEAALRR